MRITDQVGMAKRGDKEALIRLVMEKRDEYYKLACLYTQNREDSLDALQDMILILFENIRKLKDPEAFYSWSKTILVNRCRRMQRRQGRLVLTDNMEEGGEPYLESGPEREWKQDLAAGLKRLDHRQQEAIQLKYYLGYDYETISRLIGVPVGTAKSRVFNGLAKLKEWLGGEY